MESKTASPLMAPPLLPLFIMLMLVLISNPIPQSHARFTPKAEDLVTSQSGERPECDGRWIHIRSLPASFNTELLETCDAFPLMDEPLCPYAANHGLGPRTHNRSRSWYRTDPRLLEPLIHRRLMEHPCLTPDPSLADAIFLPYYASLDALPFLYSPPLFNSSALHALPLYHHLLSDQPHVYSRRHGHDHFLVLAGPAWDFSQAPDADPVLWGTSFLSRPEFFNLTVLTLESRPSPWQEHAIPHPTSFHPATLARLEPGLARARRSRRTTLMLFAGGGGGGGANIRGSIRAECENRTDLCQMVDCSDGVCSHDPIRFMRPMLRSSFCLQPPGDTPTRRSTFDGILAGCIPVFFEEISARRQYGWHLPRDRYEDFSVYIPKEDVVYGGVRITQVLSAIPEAEVRRMRERLLELAPGVMYRRHGSSAGLRAIKDAVDLAIDGVFRRIRRRVRALESRQLVVVDDAEVDGDDGWMDGSDLYGLQ